VGRAEIATAYYMAIEAVNKDPLLLPDTKLIAYGNDTTQDNKQTMFRVLMTQILDEKVSAIIGPSFSSMALIAAVPAAVYNVPLISYSATR
jgi:hypothetical protein